MGISRRASPDRAALDRAVDRGALDRADLDKGSPADRLADAAIAVIARDGFDALSVRAVAREAHITGGTVQHHFATKADLVAGALGRTVERQTMRMTAATGELTSAGSDEPGPLAVLIAGLAALVPCDALGRQEAVVWVAMSAAVPGSAYVAERHRRAEQSFRDWLAQTVDEVREVGECAGELDGVSAAPLLIAALDGVMLQAITEHTSTDELVARLDVMVHAILEYGG